MIDEKKKNVSLEIEKIEDEKCKDRYWIVYSLFFLLGLVHILPWTFFITAHDYWMYKFRNTSYDEVDSKHRTLLQKEFSPSLTISLQLSTIGFLFLTLFFGHRYTVKYKLFVPLCVIVTAFIFGAIFIHIDTDNWQTGFFALTMFIVAVINAMGSIFGMAMYSVLSNFSRQYLGAYLNGQGMATIFTSSLQVLALAIGISTEGSALVYFWIGIAVIAVSLFLMTVVVKYNHFYNYNIEKHEDVKRKKMLNFSEIKAILKLIWPSVAIMGFWILTVIPVHTSITSMVVSEGEGNGEWNDVYFVPVITFVLPAVGDYIGRVAALKLKIVKNVSSAWLTAFSALRMVVFVPLLMLCNAQPREHLPVIFPHDYQYILIMTVYSLTNGYLLSIVSLIIPKLVPFEILENSFHVYMVSAGILLGAFSFIGFITLELL